MANNFDKHVENLTEWINESPERRTIWTKLATNMTVIEYCSKYAYNQDLFGTLVKYITTQELPAILRRIYG
jgi:hypothetical protein